MPEPEVYTNVPEPPKIRIEMRFDVDDIWHLWSAVQDYNRYRFDDPDETIEPLPIDHPLLRVVHTINGILDQLILEGMSRGFYVAPLIEIKNKMAEAAADGNGVPE